MTHEQLAAAMGISRSLVTRLVGRGMPTDSVESAAAWRRSRTLPRTRRGQPPAVATDLVAARVALLEQQRREVALRVARALGEVAPIAYLQNVLAAVTAELAAHLEALPARLRLRHPEISAAVLNELAASINALRNEAVQRLESAADSISATAPWRAPWGTDDETDDDDEPDET
jgi:phage terminase Nu1 subunit (DNA packaging protein)